MNWLKRLFRKNWLGRLFRRKPGPRTPKPDPFQRPKPGADIIGRQGGHNAKRNRVHIYRQPYGYPVRLCDWVFIPADSIVKVGECQGMNGPAELPTLVAALDWRENVFNDRICGHCRKTAQGKRKSVGMAYHGHGKGAARIDTITTIRLNSS